MKHFLPALACCLLAIPRVAVAQASYDEKVTSASNVAMTISNLGLIGNGFGGSFDVLGFPSCEFPAGSGIEHVFQGGLWIGAKINGADVAVTTGAEDDPTGYSTGRAGFEYSAAVGSTLRERSSLINSSLYDPAAISHQDFVSDFTDANIIVPGTNIQVNGHTRPLNVDVHFESYNWNFNFANFFVILNFEITNAGPDNLEDVYVGYWADGVIRNVNRTPPGGTPFFNKGGNNYEDSLQLAYEFDATGDPGFTESYFGLKFLGAERDTVFFHPDTRDDFGVNYQTWQFNSTDPLFFTPQSDLARYDKMSNSLTERADWDNGTETDIKSRLNQPNNRSTLISAGPFDALAPGETVTVSFAVVCAKKFEDGNPNPANTLAQRGNLYRNAFWAQTAYNGEDRNFNGLLDPGEDADGNGRITRFILPSPPDLPQTRVVARRNAIDLFWADNAESSVDPISKRQDFEGYRIYKSEFGFDLENNVDLVRSLQLLASFDQTGNGVAFDNGFKAVALDVPITFEGDPVSYRYRYTIDNLQDGWQHAVALTAFDAGDAATNLQSLETSLLANVYRVFTGTPPNDDPDENPPFVYPNPYYGGAAWEGASTFAEDNRLMFANLPTRCVVRIFSAAGDLIDTFEHSQSYSGGDTRWFETYSDPETAVFAGGEHAWDLLSADNQIIAGGIYFFSVEDLDTGEEHVGKFVLIK